MFNPIVTVKIEIAPHDFRIVRKELSEQIVYESFRPLDIPSPKAGAMDRMLCSPYAVIERTMRSRHEIAELVSAVLTDSLLNVMGAKDTEMGYDRCECADHQGGPCSFCMEAKYNL